MKLIRRKWMHFILLAIATTLAQCSQEKELEKNFGVELDSKAPLIRVTDRTIGSTTITANWFDLGFKVTNETENTVKVEELLFYVTVDNKEEGPFTMNLGSLDVVNADTGITYSYTYCIYPTATASEQFSVCRLDSPTGSVADRLTAPPLGQPPYVSKLITYISSIPKSADNINQQVFQVRMEIIGVFLDSDGRDLDRFQKTVYFNTR